MIGADYSQIEVRLLAHISKDPSLISLFREKGDVYNNMAGFIFKKSPTEISSTERDRAKTICLGILIFIG